MPTGVGVSIEVTGHGDARTLDAVSLPLRPVSDATARNYSTARVVACGGSN